MYFLPTWSADFHGRPSSSTPSKAGAVSPTFRSTFLSSALAQVPAAVSSSRLTNQATPVAHLVMVPLPLRKRKLHAPISLAFFTVLLLDRFMTDTPLPSRKKLSVPPPIPG